MRAFGALRSPDFLRILSAQTLGRVSKYLARSALAVGLVSAASAVFGALGGNAIAIYFFVAIIVAGATASAGVILQQLETDTVPEHARRSAIGLSAWTNGIPKLFGLCFGAAIAVALPFEIVISVVAALFLGSLVACLRVHIIQRRPSGRNPWHDLATGFRYCVHASDQRAALIAAALTLAVVTPLEFLMPSVAANSDSNTTFLLAALALGGLAGGLAVASSEDRNLRSIRWQDWLSPWPLSIVWRS